jgi:predicted ATPase
MASTPPYLLRVHLKEAVESATYPFSLPIVRGLDIGFESAVTFFVGENGTGKSTVIEAIAAFAGCPSRAVGETCCPGLTGPTGSVHSQPL